MKLTILGCGSAFPVPGRAPSSQLLRCEDADYLIDCGEGTQHRLLAEGLSLNRVRAVFISHLHGDHYLGLMGLLWSMDMLRRAKPVKLFGPVGLEQLISTQLGLTDSQLSFAVDFTSVEGHEGHRVYADQNVEVAAFKLSHGVPCFGYSFTETAKQRNMITEKIEEFHLSFAQIKELKAGRSVISDTGGQIDPNEVSTEPLPPKRYVYCTDTRPVLLPDVACNADLLYHDATYEDKLSDLARTNNHSTTVEAAKVAIASKAKKLVIGHYSARYKDLRPLLIEARSVFGNTVLAEDGLVLSI